MFAIENKPVEECERKGLTRMLFTEELPPLPRLPLDYVFGLVVNRNRSFAQLFFWGGQ